MMTLNEQFRSPEFEGMMIFVLHLVFVFVLDTYPETFHNGDVSQCVKTTKQREE
jgi:hypothetical protein